MRRNLRKGHNIRKKSIKINTHTPLPEEKPKTQEGDGSREKSENAEVGQGCGDGKWTLDNIGCQERREGELHSFQNPRFSSNPTAKK